MSKLTRDQILEKWMRMPGKLSVASIPNPELRANLAVLMENQVSQESFSLTESVTGETTTGNYGSNNGAGAQFQPIALALVRRAYYEHFAHRVVGLQAMNGPVGLAYALRRAYVQAGVPGAGTTGGNDLYEAGFRALNEFSGYSGSQAGSALTVATSAIYTLSGANAGQFGTGISTSAAEAWGIGNGMPQLTLYLDKVAIQANVRMLGASFSLVAAQDLKAMHNLDMEREMLDILSIEVPAERDREIIGRMIQAAVNVSNGGAIPVTFDAFNSDGRWSQEKFSNLVNVITKASNDIATATFRGAGNFVIVSPRVATALQSAGPQFTANTAEVMATTTVTEVGKINGTITVYRDSLAPLDYALVGYKGSGINDAGIILSDFITGLYNRAVRPDDFGTNIGVLSRYAITDSLLGSGRYYRAIQVVNLDKVIGS